MNSTSPTIATDAETPIAVLPEVRILDQKIASEHADTPSSLIAKHVRPQEQYVPAQARYAFPSNQLEIVRTQVLPILEEKRGLCSEENDGPLSMYGKDGYFVLAANTSYTELCHVTSALRAAGIQILNVTFEKHND